jgi:uncharacterized radical SAM superfamily protein
MQTPIRKEITDLDSLPYPDYEGFELKHFLDLPPLSNSNMNSDRMFFLVGSRSCPYQCTFCFHTVGKKYRQRSIENILQEIQYLKDNYNVKHIRMSDELFARDKERVNIFSHWLKQNNLTWNASFRVDDINKEFIDVIKNSTCISMDFGLENADNNILKSMKKQITIRQIDDALDLAYKAGIPFSGNFIFGDIAETFESANRTLDWWENHKEYNIGLNFILTYPGAYIYKYAVQKGIIKDPVQFLKDGCPQINLTKMNEEELSIIARRIFTIAVEKGNEIKDIKMLFLDETGRMTIEGICPRCGNKSAWKNIKTFAGNNWFTCKFCGEKYVGKITADLKERLIKNISHALDKNGKTVFWGLTMHSLPLFEGETIFADSRVFFVDNAYAKQLIKIGDKKVFSPDIISCNGIKTVICFYPNSIEQVRKLCPPNVKRLINVCDLLQKDFYEDCANTEYEP